MLRKRLLRICAGILVFAVVSAPAALLAPPLQRAAQGRAEALKNHLLNKAGAALGLRISYAALSPSFLYAVDLRGLTLSRPAAGGGPNQKSDDDGDGAVLFSAERIRLSWSPWAFLMKRDGAIRSLRIDKPVLTSNSDELDALLRRFSAFGGPSPSPSQVDPAPGASGERSILAKNFSIKIRNGKYRGVLGGAGGAAGAGAGAGAGAAGAGAEVIARGLNLDGEVGDDGLSFQGRWRVSAVFPSGPLAAPGTFRLNGAFRGGLEAAPGSGGAAGAAGAALVSVTRCSSGVFSLKPFQIEAALGEGKLSFRCLFAPAPSPALPASAAPVTAAAAYDLNTKTLTASVDMEDFAPQAVLSFTGAWKERREWLALRFAGGASLRKEAGGGPVFSVDMTGQFPSRLPGSAPAPLAGAFVRVKGVGDPARLRLSDLSFKSPGGSLRFQGEAALNPFLPSGHLQVEDLRLRLPGKAAPGKAGAGGGGAGGALLVSGAFRLNSRGRTLYLSCDDLQAGGLAFRSVGGSLTWEAGGLSFTARASRAGERAGVEAVGTEPGRETTGTEPGAGAALGTEPERAALGTEPGRAALGTEPGQGAPGTEPERAALGTEPGRAALGTEPGAAATLGTEPGAAAALGTEPEAAALGTGPGARALGTEPDRTALGTEPGAGATLGTEPGAGAALGTEPGQVALGTEPGREATGTEPAGATLGTEPGAGAALGTEPGQVALGTEPGREALGTGPGQVALGTKPERAALGTEPGAAAVLGTEPGQVALGTEPPPPDIALEGSLNYKPRHAQASLRLNAVPLGDMLEIAGPLAFPAAPLDPGTLALAGGLKVSTVLMVDTDFKSVFYNTESFTLVYGEEPLEVSLTAALSGTGSRVEMREGRLAWPGDGGGMDASGEADFSNPKDISFFLEAARRDLTYYIEGILQDQRSLSLRGSHGLRAELRYAGEEGYSGYAAVDNLPLPWGGGGPQGGGFLGGGSQGGWFQGSASQGAGVSQGDGPQGDAPSPLLTFRASFRAPLRAKAASVAAPGGGLPEGALAEGAAPEPPPQEEWSAALQEFLVTGIPVPGPSLASFLAEGEAGPGGVYLRNCAFDDGRGRLTGEASLLWEARLPKEAGLPREAGLSREAGLPQEAGLLWENEAGGEGIRPRLRVEMKSADGAEFYQAEGAWEDGIADISLKGGGMRFARFFAPPTGAPPTGATPAGASPAGGFAAGAPSPSGEGLAGGTAAGEIHLRFSSLASFQGEASLDSLVMRYQGSDLRASAKGRITEKDFSLEDLRLKWRDLEALVSSASVDLAGAKAAVTAVVQGSAGGKDMRLAFTAGSRLSPVTDWLHLKDSLAAFDGSLTVREAWYDTMTSRKPFSFAFARKDTPEGRLFSLEGGPGSLLRLRYYEEGGFYAALSSPSPVRLSLTGSIAGGTIDAGTQDLYVDLGALWRFIPPQESVNLAGGFAAGEIRVSGDIKDPDFSGALRAVDGRITVPLFLPEEIRPVPFTALIENSEITFGPVDCAVGGGAGTVEARFRFDRWIPSFFNIEVKVPPESPIPAALDINGVAVAGSVSGALLLANADEVFSASGGLTIQDTVINLDAEQMSAGDDASAKGGTSQVDITVKTGRKVELLWPRTEFPILQAYADVGSSLRITADTLDQRFTITGDVDLRSGEIFYFERSFYIRQGAIVFDENERSFDPRITARAEIRDTSNEGPVTIAMIVDDGPLSSFTARFEASPPLSQAEIYSLLGQQNPASSLAGGAGIGGEDRNALLSAGLDTATRFVQFTMLRRGQNWLRDILNLDMLSVRTQFATNVIIQAAGSSSSTGAEQSGESPQWSSYFDNTTLFAGKYLGPGLFLQSMLSVTYDAAQQKWLGLSLEPDIGLEMRNPLFGIRLNVTPLHPENWFIDDVSFTLTWSRSF